MEILLIIGAIVFLFFVYVKVIDIRDQKQQEIRDEIAKEICNDLKLKKLINYFEIKFKYIEDIKEKLVFDKKDISINKNAKKFHDKCTECEAGYLIIRKGRRNKKFFGCSNYPKCKHTENLEVVTNRAKEEIMEEIFGEINRAYL